MDIMLLLVSEAEAMALVEAWRVGGVCAAQVYFDGLAEAIQGSPFVDFVMGILYEEDGQCWSA